MSAAAMELISDGDLPTPMAFAVAKKLTVPPINEAQRQLAATAASSGRSQSKGNVRQTKKDATHPMIDPMDAIKKGMDKVFITVREDSSGLFSCRVDFSTLLLLPSSRKASDAGRKVAQQKSYKKC